MGGSGVTGQDLTKIRELTEKGWNPTSIARKMRRSVGFVTKYSEAMERGLISPERYARIPGSVFNEATVREYLKTANFIEESPEAGPEREENTPGDINPESTGRIDENFTLTTIETLLKVDNISAQQKLRIIEALLS